MITIATGAGATAAVVVDVTTNTISFCGATYFGINSLLLHIKPMNPYENINISTYLIKPNNKRENIVQYIFLNKNKNAF